MVTLRDVAQAAGVSSATASRALSHPGLVVPDLHNPYFSGVTKGIQHRARLAGLSLLIADSDEDPHLEVELVQQMAPQVDAIVLCSPRMPDHALTSLVIEPPIVLVN